MDAVPLQFLFQTLRLWFLNERQTLMSSKKFSLVSDVSGLGTARHEEGKTSSPSHVYICVVAALEALTLSPAGVHNL